MPKNKNKLSVIIVNFNATEHLYDCLKSIPQVHEVIVVDNNSQDKPDKLIKSFPRVKFLFQKQNLGFSKANNLGAKEASGEFLLFLNPDTVVKPGTLNTLLSFAQKNPNLGAVAPQLLNPDGSIQPSCFRFPTTTGAIREFFIKKKGSYLKYAPQSQSPIKIDCAVGAAILISSSVFQQIRGWDERYYMYYEDFELARQIKKLNLDFWYLPDAKITHIHGASASQVPDLSNHRLKEGSRIYHGFLNHALLNTIIRLSRIKYLLLLMLLTIPSFATLIRPGYFPMHDDLQAMRLLQMDKCFKDMQIPCRWVPDMGYGYGFPLFNYYPPLPYYIGEIIHLSGVGFLDTVKILAVIGFIGSAITMFYLSREFFGNLIGLVAAVFYVYAPYHALDLYVRGAFNEFYALVFLPAILWTSYRLIRSNNSKFAILLGLSFTGILLSHNIITMISAPFLVMWVIFHLWQEKSTKSIPKIFYSGLLAFGLSSFFTLPVIFESKFVHVETLTIGYFNYLAHFIDLKQMFIERYWGFGASLWGPDELSFQIGHLHWILSVIVICFVLLKKKVSHKKTILLFTLLFLGSTFMSHLRSSFIWEKIPPLLFVQFPWRFLTLTTLAISFLAASFIHFLPKRLHIVASVLLIILILALNIHFFKPERWLYDLEDGEKFSGKLWHLQTTAGIFDYLPIFAPMPPADPPNADAELVESTSSKLPLKQMSAQTKKSNLQIYQLSGDVDQILRINTFYFPGWRGYLDGGNAPVLYEGDPLARMHIKVPPGQHQIIVKFTNTPLRHVANLITLVTVVLLIVKIKTNPHV